MPPSRAQNRTHCAEERPYRMQSFTGVRREVKAADPSSGGIDRRRTAQALSPGGQAGARQRPRGAERSCSDGIHRDALCPGIVSVPDHGGEGRSNGRGAVLQRGFPPRRTIQICFSSPARIRERYPVRAGSIYFAEIDKICRNMRDYGNAPPGCRMRREESSQL